ncbi:T-cell receptor beta chain V region A20.2.25 [Silurus asotus]|nr:T-cell receptor beta chain V region A20.2.25 [Silurus asotus]
MVIILLIFQSLYCITGVAGANDVSQSNEILIKNGQSTTMNCSHTMGTSYNRMYWYQYNGESMELIVYSPTYGTPEFGKFSQSKFAVTKSNPESGSFTVKNVDYNDSAVYFCAVSEHSVIATGQSCTKTHWGSQNWRRLKMAV